MCELYGMSSSAPVEMKSALMLFRQRGGAEADNPDGWGLVYREHDSWQLHKDTDAAAFSTHYQKSIQNVNSKLVIAHVRKANPPSPCIAENTHPFVRECCNRSWVFAHNGKVPEVTSPNGCCYPKASKPLGVTDSEHAFYYLLDEITSVFSDTTTMSHSIWLKKLAQLSEDIANYGQFNFLMSDGDCLIAYGHDRLHTLENEINDVKVVQISTKPLTDQSWQAFKAGELRIYRDGRLLAQAVTKPVPVHPQSITFNPSSVENFRGGV